MRETPEKSKIVVVHFANGARVCLDSMTAKPVSSSRALANPEDHIHYMAVPMDQYEQLAEDLAEHYPEVKSRSMRKK